MSVCVCWCLCVFLCVSVCLCLVVYLRHSRSYAKQNSAIMQHALEANKVLVDRHLLPGDSHGFGMGNDEVTRQWPKWFATWLRARGFLPA